MTAILGSVVIECTETGRSELGVVESVQQHTHRSVESLRTNAVVILLPKTLGRIPHAFGGGVEAVFEMFRQLLRALAGAEETGNRNRCYVLTNEELAFFSLEALH